MLRALIAPLAAAGLVSSLIAASAAVHAAGPTLRGFRGLMWGDPPSFLGDAQALQGPTGAVQCFSRRVENLLFGDAPLRAVRYCFHGERLFAVQLDADVDPAVLAAEFEHGYGAPDRRAGAAAHWGTSDSAVEADLQPGDRPAQATLRIVAREFAPRP